MAAVRAMLPRLALLRVVDLAYSSLALRHVKVAGRLFAVGSQALLPGGRFVLSTAQPIYTASHGPAG
jgi:hypothetical protein